MLSYLRELDGLDKIVFSSPSSDTPFLIAVTLHSQPPCLPQPVGPPYTDDLTAIPHPTFYLHPYTSK